MDNDLYTPLSDPSQLFVGQVLHYFSYDSSYNRPSASYKLYAMSYNICYLQRIADLDAPGLYAGRYHAPTEVLLREKRWKICAHTIVEVLL